MPPLQVSHANVSVFATRIAIHDGVVYTVNVEPGDKPVPHFGFGLYIVVRRGERDSEGNWQWRAHLLDANTANDPYHTQASIGVDKRGYCPRGLRHALSTMAILGVRAAECD